MKKGLILLSSYNGEKYIREQLNSILHQKDVDIDILIRDDGSKDNTVLIIKEIMKENKNIRLIEGNNLKPALSFLECLNIGYSNIYDFYSFSDQDDIWLPNKLFEAISRMAYYSRETPILYYSSSTLINDSYEIIYENRVNKRLSFAEALIRNNAQGATMVFNNIFAQNLVNKEINHIIMHDMWLNIVSHIIDANVVVDSNSFLLYRQHDQNVLGMNNNFFKKIKGKIIYYATTKNNNRSNMLKNIYFLYEKNMSLQEKNVIETLLSTDNRIVKLINIFKIQEFWEGSISQNLSFLIDFLTGRY